MHCLAKKCNWRSTWRQFDSLMSFLPNSLTPRCLLKILFRVSQRDSLDSICENVKGIPRRTLQESTQILRELLTEAMLSEQFTGAKLGADPHTVVCVDETHFTRRKHSRSGFQGRRTEAQAVIVMGFVELDTTQSPRVCTGRVYLCEIPNKRKSTFRRKIKSVVADGATIWTDCHSSYKFLGKPGSGYTWDCVVHSQGQFSKTTEFDPEHAGPVSTNAVEGLFKRFKEHIRRTKQVLQPQRSNYGLWIGEFMWMERFLNKQRLRGRSWRAPAFFHLCKFLGAFCARNSGEDRAAPLKCADEHEGTFRRLFKEWCPADLWQEVDFAWGPGHSPEIESDGDLSSAESEPSPLALARGQKRARAAAAPQAVLSDSSDVEIVSSSAPASSFNFRFAKPAPSQRGAAHPVAPQPGVPQSGTPPPVDSLPGTPPLPGSPPPRPQPCTPPPQPGTSQLQASPGVSSTSSVFEFSPPSAFQGPATRAKAKAGAWDVHALTRACLARAVDPEPALEAPGSVAPSQLKVGVYYDFHYDGRDRCMRYLRPHERQADLAWFWDCWDGIPKTLTVVKIIKATSRAEARPAPQAYAKRHRHEATPERSAAASRIGVRRTPARSKSAASSPVAR